MKNLHNSNPLGIEVSREMIAPSKKVILQFALIITVGLTVWVWFGILVTQNTPSALYVLDVGQGNSQLILLSSEDDDSVIKILIDGGRDKTVLNALDEALGKLNNKYIDLVILTHTDLDHIGGLIEVLKRYEVGMFISNGREATSEAFSALQETISSRNVKTAVLLEGDIIRYGKNTLTVLSPDEERLQIGKVNESSLVIALEAHSIIGIVKALFMADVGIPTENWLLSRRESLSADILKVGHHGSKYSSGDNFIAAVQPTISVISVGKNRYGHPTDRVLNTLTLAGSEIYQTDKDGTIKIPFIDYEEQSTISASNTGALAAIASIITGSYRNANITTISLSEARKQTKPSVLVPYKECSFISTETPTHSPIIFSEIAWMGSSESFAHEWIELQNISNVSVNPSGWQILNENERIHFKFPQKSLFDDKQYIVLARSGAKDAMGLDNSPIFTGSLRNNNEGLRLYDNECNLVDEIPVFTKWVAGDNKTKQTMIRMSDLSWSTSLETGGTPGAANR